MKRRGSTAVLVALFLGLVALLLIVTVAVARSAPKAAVRVTGEINVTGTLVYARALSGGSHGRVGDVSIQSWRVTDRFGRQIGRWVVQCRWVLPHSRFCAGEVTIAQRLGPPGKFTMAGTSVSPFAASYSVTGGTGPYDGAGGVMEFTATGLRKAILLVTITT